MTDGTRTDPGTPRRPRVTAGTRLPPRLKEQGSRAVLPLIEQVAASATTAFPVLVASLALLPGEVGAVALAQGIVFVGLAIVRGVAVTPLQLALPATDEPHRLARGAAGLAVLCGALVAVVSLVALAVVPQEARTPLLLGLFALPLLALHDCLRAYCYGRQAVRTSLESQLVWAAAEVALCGVVWLTATDMTAAGLVGSFALGGGGGAGYLALRLGVIPKMRGSVALGRQDARRRVVLSFDYLLGQVATHLFPLFAGVGSALAVAGTVVASRVVYRPATLVMNSIAIMGTASIAAAGQRGRRAAEAAMWRYTRIGLLAIGVNVLAVGGLAVVAAVTDLDVASFRWLPAVLAPVDLAFMAFYLPASQLLAAHDALRALVTARVLCALFGTVGVTVGARLADQLGICVALIASSAAPSLLIGHLLWQERRAQGPARAAGPPDAD